MRPGAGGREEDRAAYAGLGAGARHAHRGSGRFPVAEQLQDCALAEQSERSFGRGAGNGDRLPADAGPEKTGSGPRLRVARMELRIPSWPCYTGNRKSRVPRENRKMGTASRFRRAIADGAAIVLRNRRLSPFFDSRNIVKITEQEVRRVAELANLALTEQEIVRMTEDMDGILDLHRQAQRAGHLERRTHVAGPVRCRGNRHAARRRGAHASRECRRAGERSRGRAGYFKVPKVIEK